MRVAQISSQERPSTPRLAVGVEGERLLDVAAASAALREEGNGPPSLPTSRTLQELLAKGPSEVEALKELVAWVRDHSWEGTACVTTESDVRFHPPIHDPDKFLCVGKNYRKHLDELVRKDLIREIPQEPTGFIKLNSAIAAHGDSVSRPRDIEQLDYEPELAFVIGSPGRGVGRDAAMGHVFGITLFNDLTAREIQKREVESGTRFWTAKNMPGFGPLGPYVLTLDEVADVNDLDISCYVNGDLRMRLNTSGQIFKIPDIIEHFSRFIPMQAGDLFATGSAAGVAVGQDNADELFLRPGDRVEVVLDGFMTLTNTIVDEEVSAT